MYDPTIGRWISEDPIGFEAADPNLYRYVGNNPTNDTDPSGLQVRRDATSMPGWQPGERERYMRLMAEWRVQNEQDLPIGGAYSARIFFYGGTVEQRTIVRDRTLEAARRLTRALDVLENNWPEIQRRYQNVVPVDFLLQGNRRRFYIDNIRLTLNRLQDRNGSVNFEFESRDDAALTRAYVWRLGNTIHLNPVFFRIAPAVQVDIIVWELGRLVPRITGDSGEGTNNIFNWATYIRILSQDYDLIRNAGR